jgi:hypothetical protein
MEEIDKKIENEIQQKYENVLKNKYALYKGDTYEKYVLKKLKKNKYECWLWKDIPKNELFNSTILNENEYKNLLNYTKKFNHNYKKRYDINPIIDIGIDILAKINNEYIFIQCKNSDYVGIAGIESFHKIMINRPTIKGILYYNNLCSKKITKLINVEYIQLNKKCKSYDEFKNQYTELDYELFKEKCINYPTIKNMINSRKQILAIESSNNNLKWEYFTQELHEYININMKMPTLNENNKDEYKLNEFIEGEFNLIITDDNYDKRKYWMNEIKINKTLEEAFERILEKYFIES